MTEPRIRRSSDEVRALVLESARTLFRSNGYESTSTREISEHAGVAESALFRHFGSKNAVYEEVVIKPFVEFVEEFVDDWVRRPPGGVVPEQLAYQYVSGLYALCEENLDLITVLADRHTSGGAGPLARHAALVIDSHLDHLANRVAQFESDIGMESVMDVRLAVRLTVAIVLGSAQLGRDFLGRVDDGLLREIAAFVVRGSGYPGDGRVPG